LLFTALISYTQAKLQDHDYMNLLSNIADETSNIEHGVQTNNISLITQSLKDLRLNPSIEAAEIYAYDRGYFTNFSNGIFSSQLNLSELIGKRFLNNLGLKLKSSKIVSLPGTELSLLDPIVKNDNIVGGTYIKATLDKDFDILNTIEILILLAMIGVFIGQRIVDSISKPLLFLTEAMHNVTVHHNYSIRVIKSSHDEVGHLTDVFNSMLETIHNNEQLQKKSQEQIKKLAYYDTLTGLPNRDFFKKLFQQALLDAKTNNRLVGVLFLDLDNFKHINDAFGHDMGDIILKNTANNIQQNVRAADSTVTNAIFSRLSGDEFMIVLNDVTDIEDIKAVAERIIKSSYHPYMAKTKEITVTASIGIAIYPTHGNSANELIKNADIAMYYSKQNRKGHYAFFNEKMNSLVINKIELENELRKAIERNEFLLFYQPQLNLIDDAIIGFEALIRWQHPTRGLLAPDEFINIAENTGLIIDIGSWVIREACTQCKKWQELGFPNIYVSVNMSPRQFSDPNLIDILTKSLMDANLDPAYLEIELTEGMIMINDMVTLDILYKFKKIGVKISIDDFGTGYSSLRYLSQYPIDVLKIDKTFITYVNENKKNSTLTKAIIDLAHNLDLIVIAEGVETIDQLNFLKANKCDVIQGYIISRPVPENNIPALLKKHWGAAYV